MMFIMSMRWFLIPAFLLVIFISQTVFGLKIVKDNFELSVRNGSTKGIVLDCLYQLEKDVDKEGLVVKWIFNDSYRPIYQWIQGTSPQSSGSLHDRLDLSYQVSPDAYLEHRALKIKQPTTELSGTYKCVVSNFGQELKEQSMTLFLTVYTPAQHFNISVEETDDLVYVRCYAEGLSPSPRMEMVKIIKDSKRRDPVEDAESEIEEDQDSGTFIISTEKSFSKSDLPFSMDFICTLSIDKSIYKEQRRKSFYQTGGNEASFTGPMNFLLILGFQTLLFWSLK